MEGLMKVAEVIKEDTDEDVKNVGLFTEAPPIERYQISGYDTVVRYAKESGHDDRAKKLQETLNEEYNC